MHVWMSVFSSASSFEQLPDVEVVNGEVTSTYTKAIAPGIAHAALWPVRALFAAGIQLDSDAFANGGDALTAVMPKGLDKY